ncbi:AIPR family protein [Mesorhizobium sp. 10J20-29]
MDPPNRHRLWQKTTKSYSSNDISIQGGTMSLPVAQRANFVELVETDLRIKVDEDGLPLERGFAELVLDYQGFSKDEEWRTSHLSDGARDFGIDFWDITDRNVTVMQFKAFEGNDRYVDESVSVAPSDISDIKRIVDRLESEDPIPEGINNKAKQFLIEYHSLVSRVREIEDPSDRKISVNITLAALAGKTTQQAAVHWKEITQRDLITVSEVPISLNFESYLIPNLVEDKWRENNTQWRDKDGNNRDTVTLRVDGNVIEEPKSLVCFIKAIDLVRMYEDFGYQIFEPNVRCEIQRSRVNEAIRASVKSFKGRKEFKHLNNGLTVICDGFEKKGHPSISSIRIRQPGVINGLQTLKSLNDAYGDLDQQEKRQFEDDCTVLVRLHARNAVGDFRSLVKSTNNQNPMQQRNLRANDGEQIIYERLFAELGWFYERKEGAWAAFRGDAKRWGTLQGKKASDFRSGATPRTVDNEELGQCWLAYIGYSNEAVQKKTDIFREDDLYRLIYLHQPEKHGCDYGFRFDVKKVLGDVTPVSPYPKSLLAAYLARELARKLAPSAKKHRDEAVTRLNLDGATREKQNEELNRDNKYLRGVILRATTYIFPELVGFCMYKSYGSLYSEKSQMLVRNGTFKRLFENADFTTLKAEDESNQWHYQKDDIVQTLWYLFGHIVEGMLASPWKEQWLIAPNRTRFNYGYSTREIFFNEVIQMDNFVKTSQLMRSWAVGINECQGVFEFIRKNLK